MLEKKKKPISLETSQSQANWEGWFPYQTGPRHAGLAEGSGAGAVVPVGFVLRSNIRHRVGPGTTQEVCRHPGTCVSSQVQSTVLPTVDKQSLDLQEIIFLGSEEASAQCNAGQVMKGAIRKLGRISRVEMLPSGRRLQTPVSM